MQSKNKVVSWALALLLVGFAVAAAVIGFGSQSTSEVRRLSAFTAIGNTVAGQSAVADHLKESYISYPNPRLMLFKGRRIGLINYRGRSQYFLTFVVKSYGYRSRWGNIFHVGRLNGIRVPGLWQFPYKRNLLIRTDRRVGRKVYRNVGCNPAESVTPPLRSVYRVTVRVQNGRMDVFYNGRLTCRTSTVAYAPRGVHPAYLSDPWYPPATVLVKNLVFRVF